MGVREAASIAWIGPVPDEFWQGKKFQLPWCIGYHIINGLKIEEPNVEDFTCGVCGLLLASAWRAVCAICSCTFIAPVANFPYQLNCDRCDPQ